jgi:hypothetical protein
MQKQVPFLSKPFYFIGFKKNDCLLHGVLVDGNDLTIVRKGST